MITYTDIIELKAKPSTQRQGLVEVLYRAKKSSVLGNAFNLWHHSTTYEYTDGAMRTVPLALSQAEYERMQKSVKTYEDLLDYEESVNNKGSYI